ncbi:phage tail protein [Escherichia coli]|uniref:phage tail protein n=1 Tax=Escherichia coli TaxID=562 RepID=UPI0008FD48E0|nr:phage tail protein [Escherichia coli]OIZ76558.1 phage tail protein [Escherichia coli]
MPVSCYLCIFLNVGLGEGSALPVGVPVPWPSATPPTGWLKCNGAAFSAEDYPNLAKAYPTLKFPDLRGEFIRGWDGGKGVDSGRTLLSAQGDAIRNITGVVGYSSIGDSQGLLGYVSGAFSASESKAPALSGASASGYQRSLYANFNASAVVPTANENRPRNIAFNYIVRAA